MSRGDPAVRDLRDRFDVIDRIKAQTEKLCGLIDDPEAAYRVRDGAQLDIARREGID